MKENRYLGAKYINKAARLVVIGEPIKNSIKCKCLICGTEDNYKISDLKYNNIDVCKSCKMGTKIGDTFGTLVLKGYKVAGNELLFLMHCTKCDKDFLHKPSLVLSKGYSCAICNKNNTNKPNVVKIKKRNLLGSIESFDKEPQMDIKKFKGDFIFVGKAISVDKLGNKVYEKPKAQCIHCGSVTIETENYFSKYEYKCQKCNKINNDRRNIVENTNWVGYVRHNLEVIKTYKNSSGVLMANVKCLACDNEVTLPIVTVAYEPRLVCIKCGDTIINAECPICKKPHLRTTIRRMYDNVDNPNLVLVCDKQKVSFAELALQHDTITRLDNIRKRYKGYTLLDRIQGHDDVPTIFKFAEHYIGTDGKTYYTCMCDVHNKLMTLTDDEIATYKHEYCADTRMLPYNPNKKPKK